MFCNKILCLVLTVLLAGNCYAQSFDKEKLNGYLKLLEENDKFMGNVLISQSGKKVYSHALGFANIELGKRSDTETMYRIGSISKTITATLILKAIEDGKISFSENIKSFFPSIEHADQITISHLLNHHSGIHNFTGGNFLTWNTRPKNRNDLIDSIAKGGSDFAPGTKATYSNSNYVLLSFILEDVYHEPYAKILSKKITEPLHLKHFQFGDRQVNRTLPYYFEAGWIAATETDLSIPMGAGGIVSSAEDLATVLDAIFRGKIISKQMLDTMRLQSDGYGYGIFEKTISGKTAYTHDGAIDGFNSYYYYFPQDETIYILLSNAENYNLETVNNAISSIVFNKPFDAPKFVSFHTTPEELLQYAGAYKSKSIDLVIDISSKNNFLLAHPHGQRVYTMEAVDKNKFIHEKTGVSLQFIPSKNEMQMKQGEKVIVFTR